MLEVENDELCKKIVVEVECALAGFLLEPAAPSKGKCINGYLLLIWGCIWGVLGTQPTEMRIFEDLKETCENYPYSAMMSIFSVSSFHSSSLL
ncbi:hypothetical protein GGR58DRAFT_503593 [Xylaria digitata]|nr:hypothetical protein GGR58DRAFT_503593 [Xylaria digitata]